MLNKQTNKLFEKRSQGTYLLFRTVYHFFDKLNFTKKKNICLYQLNSFFFFFCKQTQVNVKTFKSHKNVLLHISIRIIYREFSAAIFVLAWPFLRVAYNVLMWADVLTLNGIRIFAVTYVRRKSITISGN